MKVLSIAILSIGLVCMLAGQNLVPNPSFEEYVECPENSLNYFLYGIFSAEPWGTPTISTDYFNVCGESPFSVPLNLGSYQMPRTGDAYAGMFLWGGPSTVNVYAEYLSCPLLAPLLKDSFYLVEFYINRSGGESYNFATDEISVLFTDTLTSFPFAPPPMVESSIYITIPQLTNPSGNFITDTIGWQRLKWIYQAKGNETFMTVGVFKAHEEINYIIIDPAIPSPGIGYYYFDDFRIEKIPRYMAWSGLGQDTVICEPSFSMELSGNDTHFHYRWSTGDTTQNITVTEAGVYILESWFADSCVVVDSIQIEHIVPETLDLGEDISLCPEDLPYFFDANVQNATFLWSTNDTTQQIEVLESGSYWVEVTHPCGIFRDTIELEVLYPPPLEIGQDTLICGEADIDIWLQASGAYDSYVWSTNETGQSIHISEEGEYWVEVFHACGSFSDTIKVVREASLSLDLGQDTILCLSGSLELSAASGFLNYNWSTGGTGTSIRVDDYGIYFLTATYACGTLQDTIEIIEPPEWNIQLPEQIVLNFGEHIILSPEITGQLTLESYEWTPTTFLSCNNCFTPEVGPESSTIYTLNLTDIYACQKSISVEIIVKTPHPAYFPTAFSPNNDGINDIFSPLGGGEVDEVLSLMIFDRWGNQLMQKEHFSANGQAGWDGTSKGKHLPAAVYVYVSEIKFKDGQTEVFFGEILLVR